ncbi:putative membrane protein [Saccharococcus thermophilus]|uniref:Putative membrane protein n=2 Tax=Saccharococcus thermophilus TaxID=29396 RepID=A0A846MCI4_9BACL|nr:putative membrane protein [Saccharococcus thermophilus]
MRNGGNRKIHLFLLLMVTAVFIWSAIKPASYLSWLLEVSPAVVGLIIVIAAYNKFRFTTLSYAIIALLSISMFIGGHYIYSKVPLFNWIKDAYDLKRNHYDRFGHLLKGLFAIVLREILLRKTPLTKGPWLVTIVLSMSLAIAALYEIIEWLVSKISNGGEAAKNFLGIQGDIWDTQWDMLCSFIGSIVALLIFSKLHNRLLKKEVTKE